MLPDASGGNGVSVIVDATHISAPGQDMQSRVKPRKNKSSLRNYTFRQFLAYLIAPGPLTKKRLAEKVTGYGVSPKGGTKVKWETPGIAGFEDVLKKTGRSHGSYELVDAVWTNLNLETFPYLSENDRVRARKKKNMKMADVNTSLGVEENIENDKEETIASTSGSKRARALSENSLRASTPKRAKEEGEDMAAIIPQSLKHQTFVQCGVCENVLQMIPAFFRMGLGSVPHDTCIPCQQAMNQATSSSQIANDTPTMRESSSSSDATSQSKSLRMVFELPVEKLKAIEDGTWNLGSGEDSSIKVEHPLDHMSEVAKGKRKESWSASRSQSHTNTSVEQHCESQNCQERLRELEQKIERLERSGQGKDQIIDSLTRFNTKQYRASKI